MRLPAVLIFAALSAYGGEISTSSANGDAIVKWNGAVVWQGQTTNALRAASVTVNGKEFAAAFDGAKALWESEPGAGVTVRETSPEMKVAAAPPKGPVAGKGVVIRLVDGETVVDWQKTQVWRGTTSGLVTSKSLSLNGTEIAAAFDNGKMIWESEPGAAGRLKQSR